MEEEMVEGGRRGVVGSELNRVVSMGRILQDSTDSR